MRTRQAELEVGRRELRPEQAGTDEHGQGLQVGPQLLELRR